MDAAGQARGVMSWSIAASASDRNRSAATAVAPANAASAMPAATNCRDLTGVSSPTGTPLRVTRKDSPRSRPRMISPLELRSSRWVIERATARVQHACYGARRPPSPPRIGPTAMWWVRCARPRPGAPAREVLYRRGRPPVVAPLARSRYLMSKRPRDVSGVWRTTSGRYSSRNTRATSSCREATPSFS